MSAVTNTHLINRDRNNIIVTLEAVQSILAGHRTSTDQPAIHSLKKWQTDICGSAETYIIQLAESETSPTIYFLTVAQPPSVPDSTSEYHTNSLGTVDKLLSLIRTQSSIPIPHHTLDDTGAIVPYQYILFTSSATSYPLTLSEARKSNLLAVQDGLRIDLQMGAYLSQLNNIQNDWFGLPLSTSGEPANPSYSWQESFTLFLETILHEAESRSLIELPYEAIRRYLSRAISFFLFDDVEVPSLVWLTGSEDDIIIRIPPEGGATIVEILPNLTEALWGDPLLESFFMPPGPSDAILEGYTGAGSGPLIVFPRQKTKRLWYTFFVALKLYAEEEIRGDQNNELQVGPLVDKKEWARATLKQCLEKLKDAPCF